MGEVLAAPRVQALVEAHAQELVTGAVRAELDELRQRLREKQDVDGVAIESIAERVASRGFFFLLFGFFGRRGCRFCFCGPGFGF